MANEQVEVSTELLQKVVGFAEATNQMMKRSNDQRSAIRKVATDAVDALEKAGKLEQGQDKNKLIEGFVNNPEAGLKLAMSLLNEAKPGKIQKKAEEEEEEGKEEGEENGEQEEEGEKEAALGRADTPERGNKRASAPAKHKESDEVWERGFGFGK